MDIDSEVRQLALKAKKSTEILADSDIGLRNAACISMAEALRARAEEIIAANAIDCENAESAGENAAVLDRLKLDAKRIEDMAVSLEELVALNDPLRRILMQKTLYNAIELTRISVPIGLVAIVYEARPNVTADAAGICIKSGNACILRGGRLAAQSNRLITRILSEAVGEAGLPEEAICSIASTDRRATDALMQLHGIVDVLIPRGGSGLIRHCVEHSQVPVIETGTGNCHVYLHASADPAMAKDIVINAKCRRFGVCNAAETLLVDKGAAGNLLPDILADLAEHGVLIHGDALSRRYGASSDKMKRIEERTGRKFLVAACESDWETEYLAPEIAVKCVEGPDEAIDHINRYGTKHSEAIVATDQEIIDRFLACVDAACVYSNASTAFSDGGQFGFGAEIGISTQKLHVRGPFALEGLVSYKYVLRGNGQVRA